MSVVIGIGIVLAAIVAFGLIAGTAIFFGIDFIFNTSENIAASLRTRRIKRNKLRAVVDPAKLATDRAAVLARIDAL
jgi:hypothetical protein